MSILQVMILGVVEGMTEFLPLSSTFHLIFTSKLLGLENTEYIKLFEVFIQSGAILPVLLVTEKKTWWDKRLLVNLLLSFIPTALVGLVLHGVIKNIFFESSELMIGMFVLVGLTFILWESKLFRKTLSIQSTNLKDTPSIFTMPKTWAVTIGLVQALAVVPGVSRAGAVILGMLFMRFTREDAVKYSFLLAVPTILSAAALDVYKSRGLLMSIGSQDLINMMIGFIFSFISAFIVTKWFLQYVRGHSLSSFGWYRVIVGALLAVMFLK